MRKTLKNTTCQTWFERDRAHVCLNDADDNTLFELWDNDVNEFVEDGFKNRRESWHEAMLRYYLRVLNPSNNSVD